MNIYGKMVSLRAIEKADCRIIQEMFNDPDIEDLVVGWSFPLSLFAQEKWLDNNYNDKRSEKIIKENNLEKDYLITTVKNISSNDYNRFEISFENKKYKFLDI